MKELKRYSDNFKIHIDKSKLRDTPVDQHVLKNNYFKFHSIPYHLKAVEKGQAELTLACKYAISSKRNAYANFWARLIIKDFEEKLLKALQGKLDKEKLNNNTIES